MSRMIDPIELKRSIAVSSMIHDGKTLEQIIDEQPTVNQWDGKSLVCNINNDMKVIVDAKTIKEIHKEGEPVVIELETEKNRLVMTVYDKEADK